jgi:hypothetical protein
VNQLVKETAELQATYDQLLSTNAKLQADISRKSSLEKISSLAAEHLGLQGTADSIAEFPIDGDALEKAEATERAWQDTQRQAKAKK